MFKQREKQFAMKYFDENFQHVRCTQIGNDNFVRTETEFEILLNEIGQIEKGAFCS